MPNFKRCYSAVKYRFKLTPQNSSLKTVSVSGDTRFCSARILMAGFSLSVASAAQVDFELHGGGTPGETGGEESSTATGHARGME